MKEWAYRQQNASQELHEPEVPRSPEFSTAIPLVISLMNVCEREREREREREHTATLLTRKIIESRTKMMSAQLAAVIVSTTV